MDALVRKCVIFMCKTFSGGTLPFSEQFCCRFLSHHFLLQLEPLVGSFLMLFGTTLQTGKLRGTFL